MNKLYMLLVSIIVFCACSTHKPQIDNNSGKKSHYHIHRYEKTQPADSAIVVVNAKRINGDILNSFILKINESEIHEITDQKEAIIYLTSGSYTFEFLQELSYRTTTKKINLSAKDSVIINFYSELNPIDN